MDESKWRNGMRTIMVEVKLFTKDDKVLTPYGEAIIQRDEVFEDSPYREVKVKWLETSQEHRKNTVSLIQSRICILIK
jgi:hypothetical protein